MLKFYLVMVFLYYDNIPTLHYTVLVPVMKAIIVAYSLEETRQWIHTMLRVASPSSLVYLYELSPNITCRLLPVTLYFIYFITTIQCFLILRLIMIVIPYRFLEWNHERVRGYALGILILINLVFLCIMTGCDISWITHYEEDWDLKISESYARIVAVKGKTSLI